MYSCTDTLAGGFPHSDMLGSKNAPVSPSLFAGCHVLHRLLSPRHSPGALIALKNPHTQAPLMALNYGRILLSFEYVTAFATATHSVKIQNPRATSAFRPGRSNNLAAMGSEDGARRRSLVY